MILFFVMKIEKTRRHKIGCDKLEWGYFYTSLPLLTPSGPEVALGCDFPGIVKSQDFRDLAAKIWES